MIGLLRLDVGNDVGQRFRHMQMHAMAPPVVVTGRALVQELRRARRRHRQVRIGEVRQRKHATPSPLAPAGRPINLPYLASNSLPGSGPGFRKASTTFFMIRDTELSNLWQGSALP